MGRDLSPASLAIKRENEMYELYDNVCGGELRLEQAFLKLGLGFAPAVSEKALFSSGYRWVVVGEIRDCKRSPGHSCGGDCGQ